MLVGMSRIWLKDTLFKNFYCKKFLSKFDGISFIAVHNCRYMVYLISTSLIVNVIGGFKHDTFVKPNI